MSKKAFNISYLIFLIVIVCILIFAPSSKGFEFILSAVVLFGIYQFIFLIRKK